MAKLIFIGLLFFAAVAISPLLINEKGYILIAMGDLTIESTVITAVIMLVLVFIALMFTLKMFKSGINFSLGTWHKIAFASKRRGIRDFNKGISAFILNDFKQAEHLFAKSAEPAQHETIGYLLAATSASKQGLTPNTDHYLKQLDSTHLPNKNSLIDIDIVTIKLLINQQDYAKARELIDKNHKLIGHDSRLLGLEIDLCIIEKRFLTAIDYLVAARKAKDITPEVVSQWESLSFYGAFTQFITEKDNQALQQYWRSIARKLKREPSISLAYCRVLAEQKITEPLVKLIVPVLKKGQDEEFIKAIRLLPLTHVEPLLVVVQKHLQQDENSKIWLSCLAHLANADQQWSMAEKAFNRLMNIEIGAYDNADLLAFAYTLEQQQQFEKANKVLRKVTYH